MHVICVHFATRSRLLASRGICLWQLYRRGRRGVGVAAGRTEGALDCPHPCGRGARGGGATRRKLLGIAAALLAAPLLARAQTAPRVVVIGGGFGGASPARFLRRANPRVDVVLLEPNATFIACPFSNEVIIGERDIAGQRFTYEGVTADGVRVMQAPPPPSTPHAATLCSAATN